MKRILVTGSAGYIGRHVVARLEGAGFEVVGLDLRSGVDVRELPRLTEIVAAEAPIGVIHLAAHSDVAESVADPGKYAENLGMTRAVEAAMWGAPTVLASSAAVYGEGGEARIAETAPPAPVNPYGASKVACEAAMPEAMRLRFFNVAGGAGDRGRHLIPAIVRRTCRGEPVWINGDGGCVRDYVHVEDVARACLLALQARIDGVKGRAINICSGAGHSVAEVVAAAAQAIGRPVALEHRPVRAGDPARLVGDNGRARDVLGWAPSLELDAMIRSAWDARGTR